GARRCRRPDPVLRPGRGRGAHRIRRGGRPGRRHPPAHRRPGQPGAAPGVPARRAVRPGDPADRKDQHVLLLAPARGRPARRAGRHRAGAGRALHLDRLDDPATVAHRRRRYHFPDPPGRRRQCRPGHPQHRAVAVRAFQRDAPARGNPMKYVSTRGGMAPQAFSDILLEGLAPDGGLAVPETLPQISADTLESWRGLSYADLAFEVLSTFATDIPADDLRRLTRAAYREGIFSSADIVPLRPLDGGLQLLGLSEGPTLAFKDMAMQFLGQVFEYVLTQRGATLNILGATSGDTGSAAEYALRGKRGVSVFMLSPHGRMSAFQRAQMYSLQDENIHNI